MGALPHAGEDGDPDHRAFVPGRTSPMRCKHDDAETLGNAAAELQSFLATIPGVYEIADSLSLGKRHLEIDAHSGRCGGGADAGRDRPAVARQLPRRGGPADSARPRRAAGRGALPARPAPQPAGAGRRARPPGGRRRDAAVRGGEPDRESRAGGVDAHRRQPGRDGASANGRGSDHRQPGAAQGRAGDRPGTARDVPRPDRGAGRRGARRAGHAGDVGTCWSPSC